MKPTWRRTSGEISISIHLMKVKEPQTSWDAICTGKTSKSEAFPMRVDVFRWHQCRLWMISCLTSCNCKQESRQWRSHDPPLNAVIGYCGWVEKPSSSERLGNLWCFNMSVSLPRQTIWWTQTRSHPDLLESRQDWTWPYMGTQNNNFKAVARLYSFLQFQWLNKELLKPPLVFI